jgi:HEAT repeat protein
MVMLLVALFAMPAAALPAPVTLPLPGYNAAAVQVRAVPHDAAFPSASGLFGETGDPLASLISGDEDLRDSVAEPQSVDALQRGLRDASVDARMAAVRAAARPRAVAGIASLSGVMLRLDEPAQLRAAAAFALGRIGDRVAAAALGEALKDPVPDVRYAAALSLGHLPADGVATRLERVLRTDPEWQPRYAAAIALGRTRKAFAASSLSDALTDDPAWQVRQQAARSLQDLGTPHAVEALGAGLLDADASVRAAAGVALVAVGGAEERHDVLEAMKTEPDPVVRAMVSSAARRSFAR